MKLRDIVRKNPRELNVKLKSDKRKNRDIPDEWKNVQGDGTGEEVNRGMNSKEGPL